MDRIKVGYWVFEVRDPSRWQRFCTEMLGLPVPTTNTDGSFGYRIDDAAQRLVLSEGRADDLAALGLELPDGAALARLVARVAATGVTVERGDDALRRARRVDDVVCFRDPAGNRIEAFVGLARSDAPFASELFAAGFRTGELGIGHLGLVARDVDAMERFYVDVLGFGVSERQASRVGPLAIRGVFLHCNRRHHSLAFLDLPLPKRVHHFMLEANALLDVGCAYERARRLGVPLSLTLGQHPAPDGTFSFYGTTPSGFDFEIGAGGSEIEPLGWEPPTTTTPSAWGHEPTARLKLKTVAALVAKTFQREPRVA